MKDSEMIELCLGIACKAHKGQIDKVGLPVILHPIHVGEMGNSTEEICVGFLHDTIPSREAFSAAKLHNFKSISKFYCQLLRNLSPICQWHSPFLTDVAVS